MHLRPEIEMLQELAKDTNNPDALENYDTDGFLEAFKNVDWLEDFKTFIGQPKRLKVSLLQL